MDLIEDPTVARTVYHQAACRDCDAASPLYTSGSVDMAEAWHEQHVITTGHRRLSLRDGRESYYQA